MILRLTLSGTENTLPICRAETLVINQNYGDFCVVVFATNSVLVKKIDIITFMRFIAYGKDLHICPKSINVN